jgi:diacylglycerol kinase family enzyme
MTMLLIMNPSSRSGRGRRLWPEWRRGLGARGIAFDCAETGHPGHARELARSAPAGCMPVAVGGDGTINEVLDGVMQREPSQRRMGVLYSGTSPDFCRFHRIPVEPAAALDALASGRASTVDVARLTYRSADGAERAGHFGCGCNVGLGSAIARVSNRVRRYLGDTFGTGAALLLAVARAKPVELELQVDGSSIRLAGATHLAVLKNPYIASGLRVAVDLRPDDGRLAVIGIHGQGRWGLLRRLPGFYTGRVAEAPGIFRLACDRISVRSRSPVDVEFDGDPQGQLPVEIKVLPRALALAGGLP